MKEFYKTYKKYLNIGFLILGILMLFLIYEFVYLGVNNPVIIPSLNDIFSDFFILLGNKDTYIALGHSLLRTITALAISFIFGFILGLLSGLFEPLNNLLKPLISMMKCIPVPCFVFVIFIFLHTDIFLSTTIVVFMVIFPIIYESMKEGVRNIDEDIIKSLKIEGLYRPKSITRVIIPMSFPYLALSLLTSFGLGIKVEITSEIIFNSNLNTGIGALIQNSYFDSEYSRLFALIIVVLIIFLILDLIRYLLKDKLLKLK